VVGDGIANIMMLTRIGSACGVGDELASASGAELSKLRVSRLVRVAARCLPWLLRGTERVGVGGHARLFEHGPAERLGQPGLGILPGEAVRVDEFAPCFVGGAERDESSRAFGADSVMQATECGDALDGELGCIAVTTLSLGDCAGEVGLGAGGGEQSADDVAAAFLERLGEMNLGRNRSWHVSVDDRRVER
jgi:hypothetical protein